VHHIVDWDTLIGINGDATIDELAAVARSLVAGAPAALDAVVIASSATPTASFPGSVVARLDDPPFELRAFSTTHAICVQFESDSSSGESCDRRWFNRAGQALGLGESDDGPGVLFGVVHRSGVGRVDLVTTADDITTVLASGAPQVIGQSDARYFLLPVDEVAALDGTRELMFYNGAGDEIERQPVAWGGGF
jgi:hypothetical protein